MNPKFSFLVAALLLVLICSLAFAQQTEEITFTTYYPSPYGSYNVLEATNIIHRPQSAVPLNPEEGQVVYIDSNTTDTIPGQLRIFSGGSWRNVGGVGAPIGVRVAYKGKSDTSVSISIPEGASYALLSMQGNETYGSGHPSEEDAEAMEAFIDFGTGRSSGSHALTGGGDDTYTIQYVWNEQLLGFSPVMIGDTDMAPACGVVVGPIFTRSGNNLIISNLNSNSTWQQSFFIMFY